MKYAVCCPTYKKEHPLCLNLLNLDKTMTLYLFVRKEDYDNGYYSHLINIERLCIIRIEKDVKCIGETRQYILDWCKNNNVEYCVMIDDGVYSIQNECNGNVCSKAIEQAIDMIESDELSEKLACFTFSKREALSTSGEKIYPNKQNVTKKYFLCFPLQCNILNMKVLSKYDIRYKSLDSVGFEDGALFVDMLKNGLICAGRAYLSIDGVIPNQKKLGGNHTSFEDLEDKYDRQTKKLLEYAGRLMGVSIQKRYRAHIGGYLTLLIWDYDYYREVLCEKRKENFDIIEKKLTF